MTTAYSAVIFDFNGVLLWDNFLHDEAWRQMSASLRGRPLSDDEMTHHVHGRTNQDILRYVLGRTVTGDELSELAEEKESIYRQLCLDIGDEFALSTGAIELLDRLHGQNTPRTIATSSGWSNVRFYINRLDLGRWFNLDLLVHDRGAYPGKPAPHIYLDAAGKLGLRPSDCIVVEDSRAGIASAHAAGIGHIIALGPAKAQAELALLPGVNRVIANLGEFPLHLLGEASEV